MERSFILCEQPRSRSQRPMEMGCAYNEAQVRVTLFKKWIRHARSQLEWTQVLQALLSGPFLMITPPRPSSSSCSVHCELHPDPLLVFIFVQVKEAGAKIKLWLGDSWTPGCCVVYRGKGPSAAGGLLEFGQKLPAPPLAEPRALLPS